MQAATKFIVWDWNGTLLDDVHSSHEGMNVVLARYKRPPVDLDAFREIFDMPLRTLYLNAGFTEDEVRENLPTMQHVFHDYYEPAAAESALRVGVEGVLKPLKNLSVAQLILSNHIVKWIHSHLHRLGLSALFDAVLANDGRLVQMGAMKKGERLLHYMSEKSLDPNQGIIIGDTPEEIGIARDLGLASVALTGGYASEARLEGANPDYLIHTLGELVPVLERHGFVS